MEVAAFMSTSMYFDKSTTNSRRKGANISNTFVTKSSSNHSYFGPDESDYKSIPQRINLTIGQIPRGSTLNLGPLLIKQRPLV
jgi:hypothetical protein